jgi:hypothetical protein
MILKIKLISLHIDPGASFTELTYGFDISFGIFDVKQ